MPPLMKSSPSLSVSVKDVVDVLVLIADKVIIHIFLVNVYFIDQVRSSPIESLLTDSPPPKFWRRVLLSHQQAEIM
jgi:hypothetical protein